MDEELDNPNQEDYSEEGITTCIPNVFGGIKISRLFTLCGDKITQAIDEYNRTASDDLRDIANSLLSENDFDMPLLNTYEYNKPKYELTTSDIFSKIIDIKIRIDKSRKLTDIMVKYIYERRYVRVPFEPVNNPDYIQNIIDNWFTIYDNEIYAKSELFDELEIYYRNTKRNRNTYWFEKKAEWIKFSYSDSNMRPCGFKRFQQDNTDSDISELSEN